MRTYLLTSPWEVVVVVVVVDDDDDDVVGETS